MIFFKRIVLVILTIIASYDSDAQGFDKRARYHSIGLNLIGTYFNGDVSSGLKTVRPGIGLQYIYKFSSNVSFAGGMNYFRLLGDDDTNSNVSNPATVNKYIRNLHFRNDVMEWFAQFRFDVFSNTNHYQKRPSYNIFAAAGLGLLYGNPQAKDSSGTWVDLRPLKTEGVSYSSVSGFIPLSIGARYKISGNIDLELEVTYRITFTDYLDDVKGKYADPSTLNSASSRDFANRSAEPVNAYNGQTRDMDYVVNTLGYPVLTASDGQTYISGTGPGQARGSKVGPDGYVLAMLRLVFIIPQKGISCPRYRD